MEIGAICSQPVAYYFEDADPYFTTTSFQVIVENKVSPESHFLQAVLPQVPQLLFKGLVFQTFPSFAALLAFHCPS